MAALQEAEGGGCGGEKGRGRRARGDLEGLVHGTPGVLICVTIDSFEELLQSRVPL